LAYSTVRAGEQTAVTLTYRESDVEIPVLGVLERNEIFRVPEGLDRTIGDITGASGAIIAWIEPEREPTKHLLREISELAEPFTELGAPILLAVGDSEWSASFDPNGYPGLPSNALFVRDSSYDGISTYLSSNQAAGEAGFPHLFVLDGLNQIRFVASGYRIGTGKEVLQIVTGLQQRNEWRSQE
jgi:hypothetical protein